MADATTHAHVHEERTTAKLIFGGSLAETIIAIGTVVLAILGLVGFLPIQMLAISTISLGASFLFEGGAIASRLSKVVHETSEGKMDISELGGGLTAEFIAGLGGIALGILALVAIVPLTLTAVAVIAFGSTLVMGAGVKHRLTSFFIGQQENTHAQHIANEAVLASSGVQVLVGLGAIVLGILALLQIEPIILTLIGILSVSGTMLISGTAIGSKMMSVFRM